MWFLRIALPSVLLIASASLFNARADDGPADDGPADGARDTSAYQELVEVPMVDTPTGRQMLGYLAACALPTDFGAYAEKDGERYDFPGAMGLVPGWLDDPMTASQQRWVSACVLALKGLTDDRVAISMRAANSDNPALRPSEEDLALYSIHEGGFFGNLFFSEPVAFACGGDRAEAEEDDPVMQRRMCTQRGTDRALTALGLTACGFRFIGVCSQLGTPEVGGVRYDEMIEVYLKPEASKSAP